MSGRVAIVSALCALAAFVAADPLITPAVQLAPRATDPAFVGYISSGGSFSAGRSCDYPQTVSTSGSYVQCCPTTGACPFYTACSANTLIGAGTQVPCDFDGSLTCNTGIVLPTASAAGGASYLACWQKTLGSSAFTFVQNIGSATVLQASTTSGGSSTARSTGSSGGQSSSTASSTSRASTTTGGASTTSSPNAAPTAGVMLSGGVMGAMAIFAQALL